MPQRTPHEGASSVETAQPIAEPDAEGLEPDVEELVGAGEPGSHPTRMTDNTSQSGTVALL